jgi:hypothetical protein
MVLSPSHDLEMLAIHPLPTKTITTTPINPAMPPSAHWIKTQPMNPNKSDYFEVVPCFHLTIQSKPNLANL